MMARTLSLAPLCFVLSGCTFPFTFPAFGRPADVGTPSFINYSESHSRLEMSAKLRGLTPYVASADPKLDMKAEGEEVSVEPQADATVADTAVLTPPAVTVVELAPAQVAVGAAELPPAPVPPCSDGTAQKLWVMEPGSDLAEGLRQWTSEAGLAAFYTDTSGWRFPMGNAGVHFNGCFEGAVMTALELFARHSVRPKVQVDRDGYVYLSVFMGAS